MCHHILYGKVQFEDEKNNMEGVLNIGEEKGKAKDYFTGYIEHNNQKVCQNIEGTYMGYTDFDSKRYFDVRHQNALEQEDIPLDSKEPICL